MGQGDGKLLLGRRRGAAGATVCLPRPSLGGYKEKKELLDKVGVGASYELTRFLRKKKKCKKITREDVLVAFHGTDWKEKAKQVAAWDAEE